MNGETSTASADVVRCPVCTHGSMIEGGTSCASCASDLAVLAKLARVRRVVTANTAPTAPAPETRKRSWAPAAWLFVGAVIGGVVGAALPGRSRAADVLPVASTEPVAPETSGATRPRAASAAADTTATKTLDDLAARLTRLEDVVTERRGDRLLLLTARSELFGKSAARLGPSETALVRGIASALQGSVPLRIHVRGHTDASPTRARGAWANNWVLGMSRAQAVALALDRHSSGEANRSVIEISSGAADTPEIGGESGPRRTVVLLVSTISM